MADLTALLALQRLDAEHDRLVQQLERARSAPDIAELEAAVARQAAAVAAQEKRLAELRRQARWEENEAAEVERERARQERKLYGGTVTNLKELEQLQAKVEELRRKVGHHEEAALVAMEESDALAPEVQAAAAERARLQALLDARRAEQAEICRELEARLAEIPARRAALVEAVDDPRLVERYERNRGRGGGIAVAAITDGRCEACRVKVSAAILSQARANQVVQCENCGRILVWEGKA